jgi:hypothetical protein
LGKAKKVEENEQGDRGKGPHEVSWGPDILEYCQSGELQEKKISGHTHWHEV